MLPFAVLVLIVLVSGGTPVWSCAQFREVDSIVDENNGPLEVCVMFNEPVMLSPQVTNGTLTIWVQVIYSRRGRISRGISDPQGMTLLMQNFIVFEGHTDDVCITVEIQEDNVIGDFEVYELSLLTDSESGITLCSNDSLVFSVADATIFPVNFTSREFVSDGEEGVVNICFNAPVSDFRFDADLTFFFDFAEEPRTASMSDDVIAGFEVRTINSLSPDIICESVSILPDDRVEGNEFLEVTLTILGAIVNFTGGNARLVITDDDVAQLSLMEESVVVPEGDTGAMSRVLMCIMLDSVGSGLDRGVELLLSALPGTATSPEDYVMLANSTFTIPAGAVAGQAACISVVAIVGDLIREENETFSVRIESVSDNVTTPYFHVTIASEESDNIDECEIVRDICDVNAECVGMFPGSCVCNFGYTGDGRTCTNINECAFNGSFCDVNAECIDTPGGFNCTCLPGYADGYTAGLSLCTNIDECETGADDCDENAKCRDTPGSFTCACNPGYSGDGFTCTGISCGILLPPENGFVEVTGINVNSTALYSCAEGHFLDTETIAFTRVCMEDAIWSGSAPSCIPVDCGPLFDIENGRVFTDEGTDFGSRAVYSCDDSLALVGLQGEDFRVCMADGMWSATEPTCEFDCGVLRDPLNGTVMHNATTFSSQAVYGCDVGFQLIGGSVRVCGTQGWSGESPECQEVGVCDPLPPPDNGAVSSPARSFGSVATYSCLPRFSLTGPAERICTDMRTWSGEAPVCSSSSMSDATVDATVIGGSVGGVLILALLLLIIVCVMCITRGKKKQAIEKMDMSQNPGYAVAQAEIAMSQNPGYAVAASRDITYQNTAAYEEIADTTFTMQRNVVYGVSEESEDPYEYIT